MKICDVVTVLNEEFILWSFVVVHLEIRFSLWCLHLGGSRIQEGFYHYQDSKRDRLNYASRIDNGGVVSSDEGECVIKTFMWIKRSTMKAFV